MNELHDWLVLILKPQYDASQYLKGMMYESGMKNEPDFFEIDFNHTIKGISYTCKFSDYGIDIF